MNYLQNKLIDNGWKITYDGFNIDFNVPFFEQSDELNEDLIQAEKDSFIIDIGWYPEADITGAIQTLLIHNNDWVHPLISFEDRTCSSFIEHFKYVLSFKTAE